SVAVGSAEGARVIGRMVEIADAVLFQPRDKRPDEAIGFRHAESGNDRKESEGKRDDAAGRWPAKVPCLSADREHYEREFADLAEVRRRDDAGAQPLAHEIQRRDSRCDPSDDDKRSE